MYVKVLLYKSKLLLRVSLFLVYLSKTLCTSKHMYMQFFSLLA